MKLFNRKLTAIIHLMSSVKGYEGSATKSIDYNRSSSKRLYEFVFKIVFIIVTQIDHD